MFEPESKSNEPGEKQDNVEPNGDKNDNVDDFELTNEIPTTTAKEHDNVKSHGGGYHASSAPTDFMKKKYKSELLHVSWAPEMP